MASFRTTLNVRSSDSAGRTTCWAASLVRSTAPVVRGHSMRNRLQYGGRAELSTQFKRICPMRTLLNRIRHRRRTPGEGSRQKPASIQFWPVLPGGDSACSSRSVLQPLAFSSVVTGYLSLARGRALRASAVALTGAVPETAFAVAGRLAVAHRWAVAGVSLN